MKFRNGDNIACGVDDSLTMDNIDHYDYIIIHQPVIFSSFKFLNDRGQVVETIGMAPFIPTSNDEEITVPRDSILTICSLRPGALERYESYLEAMREELTGQLDRHDAVELTDEVWDAMDEAEDQTFH